MTSPVRPFRICLIEDSAADAVLFREALSTIAAPTALEVIDDSEIARERILSCEPRTAPCPDIYVLDLNLPKIDGFDLLSLIRTSQHTRLVPVIVLSSSSSPRDIERAYALGANSYLCKPEDLRDFFDMVRTLEAFWLGVAKLPTFPFGR